MRRKNPTLRTQGLATFKTHLLRGYLHALSRAQGTELAFAGSPVDLPIAQGQSPEIRQHRRLQIRPFGGRFLRKAGPLGALAGQLLSLGIEKSAAVIEVLVLVVEALDSPNSFLLAPKYKWERKSRNPRPAPRSPSRLPKTQSAVLATGLLLPVYPDQRTCRRDRCGLVQWPSPCLIQSPEALRRRPVAARLRAQLSSPSFSDFARAFEWLSH
jgi:hypothetical protein